MGTQIILGSPGGLFPQVTVGIPRGDCLGPDPREGPVPVCIDAGPNKARTAKAGSDEQMFGAE